MHGGSSGSSGSAPPQDVPKHRWDRLRCLWAALRVDDTADDRLCSGESLARGFGAASYGSEDVSRSCGDAIAQRSMAALGSGASSVGAASCRSHALVLACDLGHVLLDDEPRTGAAADVEACACALQELCRGAGGGDARRHFAGLLQAPEEDALGRRGEP